MKYISLLIDLLLVVALWSLAFIYWLKGMYVNMVLFGITGLNRLDIANLYWKIKNDK